MTNHRAAGAFSMIAAAALIAMAGMAAAAEPPPNIYILASWIEQPDETPEFESLLAGSLDFEVNDPVVVPDPTFPMQFAHAGQLSPKDDCHRHRSAGERHWHLDGTSERGGPCVKQDGETWKLRNHAICAEARILLIQEDDWWRGDYESAAEALKECIVGLDPPES